ncbi:unnamed protein product [Rhizoctonia solani]|uniref:Protein kinase domain-containing protein n=1 Tax=Rhizoctonia solani TaxID=456999 RepID=A0A8H3E5M9_9AGAM|nr:unnamed protein product [Rhizoctonia solani]
MVNFYLNCFILGDKSCEPIPVKTSPDHKILELIQDIIEAYGALVGNIRLVNVELFKVDLSAEYDDLAGIQVPSGRLRLINSVKDYWENLMDLDITRVHVLVKADVVPVIDRAQSQYESQRESDGPTSPVSSAIKQLSLPAEHDKTAKGFQNAPSASDAAVHAEFKEQQNKGDIPIYNGRPLRLTEIPIQLFHPAFDLFEAKLNVSAGPTARDYQAVESLLIGSQELYDTDTTRWRVISGLLSAMLGYPIDSINRGETGGVVVFSKKYSIRKAYGVIIEVKNEIGTGSSDPWIQGAQSYSRYWSQEEMTELRLATRCPSLIISIAGPWMCVSGAVYLDHVVVQPLTEYVWMGVHPQRDNRLVRMTQLFNAVSQTIASLSDYYAPFITKASSLPIDHQRFFPHINRIAGPNGPLEFTYNHKIGDSKIIRPVFEATAQDGSTVVVKFAQSYNFKAHKLLAEQALAPVLLSQNEERVCGGFFMVVMELSGTSLDNYPELEQSTLEKVRNDIKKALEILHKNSLVFGDLRPPNVLITRTDNGSLRGQLVDFDWCGIEGKANYPVGMNQGRTLGWATGVEKGALLSRLHDEYMFENLFEDCYIFLR